MAAETAARRLLGCGYRLTSPCAVPAGSRGRQSRLPPNARERAGATSNIEDLARIHDVLGVDRALYPPHDFQRVPMLGLHMRLLAKTDAMLARTGPAHILRDPDQRRVDLLGLRALARVIRVEQQNQMKIPVTRMAHQRREDRGLGNHRLNLLDTCRQLRKRHADIRRQPLDAGPERPSRITRIMADVPEVGRRIPVGFTLETFGASIAY